MPSQNSLPSEVAVVPPAGDAPRGGLSRRGLLGRAALAAGGVASAPALLAAGPARAAAPVPTRAIPRAARPGGAYDRYVAALAAKGEFSGVVLLTHQGRTVLSRSYGMADTQRGVPNTPDVAFLLSSASQPFLAVAVLQLVQRGKLALGDTVGQHLRGFPADVGERVTLHHLLSTSSGLSAPVPDPRQTFSSTREVHAYYERWTRQAKLVSAPGSSDEAHTDSGGADLAIAALVVEAVSGQTFWDYVHDHVLRPAGMTRSGFFTRTQWARDRHIAHAYMRQPDGSHVDAVRHLETDSLSPQGPHENPARGFIGYAGGNAFATANDLARFGRALDDGTLLDRPFADVLTGATRPGHGPRSYESYLGPIAIVRGPQWLVGRGGGTGGAGANLDVYRDSGWVGVVLTNRDDTPLVDILLREIHAITGEPIPPAGGGGGG